MKAFLPVLVLLAASGPAFAQDPVDEKLAKLEMKMQEQLNKAFAFNKTLLERVMKLEERITKLETENQMLKVDIERLSKRAPGPGPEPTPTPTPEPPLADTAMKIEAALVRLKSGGTVEEGLKELVPLSRWSCARMIEALAKHPADRPFIDKIEQVLGKCPVEDLKAPLTEGAKDRTRRITLARVVAAVGDKELSRALEPYAGDVNPFHQIEVGKALIACKNRNGIPALMKALRAEESEYRLLAIMSLRPLAKGEIFGFDFNRGPAENADSLKRWDAWWESEGQKLFE